MNRIVSGGWAAALVLLLILTSCTEEPVVEQPIPSGLYVDAAQSLGEISPYVYGTNFGPWMVVTADLFDEAENAGITFLRWPGGHWGDSNNVTERQVDQYIDLARKMGAEPSINVRLLGGSPEQSAELVRYTNIEKGYGVQYWGIGNEPTLYDDYSTAQFNTEWREHAEVMLAVDPDIQLFGPEPHQYAANPRDDLQDDQGIDYLESFLETNGDLLDIVAVHRYPFPVSMNDSVTIDDLRQNSAEWDTLIPALRQLVIDKTGRDLPLAVTEINSNWSRVTGGEATPDSFYNAIWWGDVLGRLIKNEVDYVAHFRLQSRESGGGFGLLARFEVRPTYYTYQMYRQFGDKLLFSTSDENDVQIYAAARDDGALTLMIVNLGGEAAETPLSIANFDGQLRELVRFDAQTMAESIPFEPLQQTINLPAQSMTLLILQ